MGNNGGIGKAEVKISVGLIGALLAILVTAIVHRSGRHPVVDEVPAATRRFVADGDVVPAEFHGRSGTPVVLKPRASLPPPVYAAQTSPAAAPAIPSRSANPLTMASDTPAARDFMPKLPATEPSDNAPSATVPAEDQPPRYAPVVMPQVDDRPAPPGRDAQRAIRKPITAAPAEAEEGSTEKVAMPAGPPPAAAAPGGEPAPAPAVNATNNQRPPERDTAKPIGVAQTTAPLASPIANRGTTAGSRRYLVEEGDSLAVIARYELGDVNRWTEIYQLNRALLGSHPESLYPGTWLSLPPGVDSSTAAHQRSDQLDR